MAKRNTVYSIFIASPGDTKAERQIVHDTCVKLNQQVLVTDRGVQLSSLGWEQAMPQAGNPRTIINKLAADCDLLICLFHRRFGSPTANRDSGTLEEFLNAYEQWKERKKPQIFLYFKEIAGLTLADLKDPQLEAVLKFKEQVIADNPVLYKEFKDETEFTGLLEKNLAEWITTLPQPDSPPAQSGPPDDLPPAVIPLLYKTHILNHECCFMDIKELRPGTKAVQLRLPEVYIPLFTTADNSGSQPDAKHPAKDKEQRIGLEELAARQDCLVIKGEAGCGKTTLLKHLTWSIITGENQSSLRDRLPVLIFLRQLKGLLPPSLTQPGAGTAEEILHLYLQHQDCGLDLAVVKSFCRAGRVIFLLDGLDEVDDRLRDLLADSFSMLADRHPSLKLVFSGRPHGISGSLLQRYSRQVREVLAFTEEQIAVYVKRWWTEAHAGDNSTAQQEAARNLIRDLAANADIAGLKGNPLMLTAICFLYLDNRCLPDQRADLYDRFVQRLLVNRFKDDRQLDYRKLLFFFMELAHAMFTRGDKEIDKVKALAIFTGYCSKKEKGDEVAEKIYVEDTFDRVEAGSGLLKNCNHTYEFTHLSIQEFLTAAYIMSKVKGDPYPAILPYLKEGRYGNVIRLYIGLLSIKNSKGAANQIVINLLEQNESPEIQLLAGDSLLDIHKELREEDSTALTIAKMQAIIDSRTAPAMLARAGEILGWLGDSRDLRAFVKIKGGKYQLANPDNVKGLGAVQLADFEIGKYPVTNSWYSEFVTGGGYADQQYWTEDGWRCRTKEEIIEPIYWHDRRLNCPNAPVVGVSWYEATAFVRWLTISRNDGHTYRLPTEAEWQLAAGGKQQTEYPWGKSWNMAKCNAEQKIGKTTAVGIYLAGSTPVDEERSGGISDLAGNVWEWTDNKYHEFLLYYVVRGGSWYSDHGNCRCACRNYGGPIYWFSYAGFRCART